MRVHQSLLNDCLLSMQYSIETKVFHGGSVRAVGTGYHKSLEVYYRHRMIDQGYDGITGHDLDRLVQVGLDEFDLVAEGAPSHSSEHSRDPGVFKWNERVPDHETAHGYIDTMVRSYFDNGHFWPLDWKIIGVELDFELPWYNEHTRGGQIDLALIDPNGWLVGDDQKTAGKRGWNRGKEHPRKNIQGNWYNGALRELFPGFPGYRFTFSIMKYNGDFDRRICDPTPAHIEAAAVTLRRTNDMYHVLKANGMDMPANPASTLCSPEWCDFWKECPHGEALDT